ncbi:MULTISPECIES: 30S ribosomal protein S20 [Helicobacter]|uniref:Small ribosomal subunit protein bS20 n=2 Tax=Helicobacter TaxID=209 RepID=A0A0K2X7C8_9HELI|nr:MULTISPECIES: 30S ribosomal protein S20 [Helicobacter]CCM11875.1 SSU ribosomal protein S20p [Helicobacter heilmannii ASB1.4]CRF40619.1 SSU ribosomal protein S20p [Helicobacter ailurogastricus]CRF42273.1 SSU ribosomal protein S20p [Helicobacter ailurogastricus]CRF44225.1 SSU ribosomal protein S20p [Helicobacter ailurogastricus]CRI34017.1 SSU ribosomal protein S20p [Helicobacter heilmannii]
MANHKSAEKRIRQTIKRTERNRFYKTRIKNVVKAVREAIASHDVPKAQDALKVANKELHKFVSKGVLKKNTASRKVSRLNASVKKIALANA